MLKSCGPHLEFFKLFHVIFSLCPVEEGGESGSGDGQPATVLFFFHPMLGIQILTSNFLTCKQMLLAQVNPAQPKPAPFKTFSEQEKALAQSKG